MVNSLFVPLICTAHPSFPSHAASSTSPASEPPQPQARPSGPSTESKANSNSSSVTGPPPKRRRAKRTEEERIQYLRSDPYVAQFDAYRVLCGSCNKWIRLRPNSTFCSIPWDAHRKSCLSRKGCVVMPPTFPALRFTRTKCPPLPAQKNRPHRLLQLTLTPTSMMPDESSVRHVIAGFLSAKKARLHKHGHSTVPSAVLHPPQLRLQSRGPLFRLYRHFVTIRHLQLPHLLSITAFRHHHSTSSRWFRRSHLRHHEQPRKRKRIAPHQAHLRQRQPCRLPHLNRHRRHQSQTHPCLHLPLAPPAASPADEMQSSARPCCAPTRYWHRWSPTACSARCATSGFSFDRTAHSVRTHGSSTAANVSFDS
jgi:hypothetical protein